jgi:hypothetical protein
MKAALALSLLLPLTARAELILIDYQGTVTSSASGDRHVVGSPFDGHITVDTDLAGPDIDPRPNFGRYGWDGIEHVVVPNFVTSSAMCRTKCPSSDMVFVTKDFGDSVIPNLDLFEVDDGVNGTADRLVISVRARDVLQSEGLSQSFELGGDANMFGFLLKKGDIVVGFVIDHLRVRPGSCPAP